MLLFIKLDLQRIKFLKTGTLGVCEDETLDNHVDKLFG